MSADLKAPASESAAAERKGVLPVGTKLGKYELTGFLGQGGFGVTYLAYDSVLSRNLAIKEYLPASISVRESGTIVLPRSTEHAAEFVWGRERFVEEARILARLDRALAIVRVYDFLEENGTAYMVMALVEGETLSQRLKRAGSISPAEAERLLLPLQIGLEQVHAAGFLHRDIKPANIIIDEKGEPTLIDFGASRAAVADRSVSMTAIFTPGYAAVEQFTSAKQGPWTDIYGLSATIYHALTGKTPPNAIERILDDEYSPLADATIPNLTKSFSRGIDAGMAVKSVDRPQSIADWRQCFGAGTPTSNDETVVLRNKEFYRQNIGSSTSKKITAGSLPIAEGPSAALQPEKKPKSGKLIWIAAAAGAVALAGGGSIAIWGIPGASKRTVVVDNLQVEDLQKLLDERKKADEALSEKRRLEEEARLKSEDDARRKKQAEAEFAEAQSQRQKAEQELAKLKASIEERRKQDESEKQATAEADARRTAELEAQRKIEVEMAALQKAEEEAKQRVAAEAEAKRKADEELTRAAAERLKAEESARKAAEEAEARRKADEEQKVRAAADAEAKRKADEEVRRKAEAATEAKRKADEEVRLKAEVAAEEKRKSAEEAKRKAEAEAAALAEKKAAEAAENTLKLTLQDRQRIQVGLTSLGFDTRGSDGVFGQRSRDMIAAWQKARSLPETGFITAAHQQALITEAAAAITKFDDDQKKMEADKKAAEDAKKKADDEAKAKADLEAKKKAALEANKTTSEKPEQKQAVSAPAPPASTASGFDGNYSGGFGFSNQVPGSIKMSIVGSSATGTVATKCSTEKFSLSVDPSGAITGQIMAVTYMGCGQPWKFDVRGKVDASGTIRMNFFMIGTAGGGYVVLKKNP